MKGLIFRKISILAFSLKHPRCPWYAKAIIWFTLAMAISPIDLIPDFIPFLGQLDDVLLIPLGVWLAYFLLPQDIVQEAEKKLVEGEKCQLKRYAIVGIIVTLVIWILIGVGLVVMVRNSFFK